MVIYGVVPDKLWSIIHCVLCLVQIPRWYGIMLTEEGDRHDNTFKRPCTSPVLSSAGQSSMSPPSKKRRVEGVSTDNMGG